MSNSSRCVVVIGAGHAGAGVVGFLRQYGYDGRLVLIGDEPHLPYQRPPLSKAWLKGEADTDSTALRPLTWYESNHIELLRGTAAVAIDRENRRVALADGKVIDYDYLVIATGSRAIVPPIPGIDLKGVQCLRSADDAESLKSVIEPGKNVAIVGGGYIGLEVAASAISLGATATVIEREERLLARSASSILAAFFADFQRAKGIDILLGTSVVEVVGSDGHVTGLCHAAWAEKRRRFLGAKAEASGPATEASAPPSGPAEPEPAKGQ